MAPVSAPPLARRRALALLSPAALAGMAAVEPTGATVATSTAPAVTRATAPATASPRRFWKNRPVRMGSSTRYQEAMATAKVAARRAASRGRPSSPVWAWLMTRNRGQW